MNKTIMETKLICPKQIYVERQLGKKGVMKKQRGSVVCMLITSERSSRGIIRSIYRNEGNKFNSLIKSFPSPS